MGIQKDLITTSKRGKRIKQALLKESRKLNKELTHTYRHLTKAEIAVQYTPERIARLLERGQDNLKKMRMVYLRDSANDD